MPDNELMSVDPGQGVAAAPLPAPGVPSNMGIDLLPPQPVTPGVAPAAAITAPAAAPVPAAPQEDQLQRALRLLDTDSSQLNQSDWNLIAADQLMKQNQLAAGRGGPTHQVKVGETNSFSTQRTKVAPGAKAADAAVASSLDLQAKATLDQAHAAQAELAAKAAMQDQHAQQLAQDNAQRAEAEAGRQARMQQLEAEQTRLAQDVAKEARGIDPDRWLHQSAGRAIGASLAAALGAYGATLAKTPNFALQIINDAIDRDFAGQKLKLQSKQDQQSMQARTIERTRALFGDQRAGDMAARANIMELHKAQLEQLGTKFKQTEVEANAAQSVALLTEEQAKLRAQAAHLEDVHQSSNTQSQVATVDGTGNAVGSGTKGQVPLTAYEVSKLASELKKKNDEAKFTGGADTANQQRRTRETLDRFAAFNTMLNSTIPAWEKATKDSELIGAGPFTIDKGALSPRSQDKEQIGNTVRIQAVKAFSGAQSSDQERAQIASTWVPDPNASAERQIRGMKLQMGIRAAEMRALYDSLTPDGKQEMLRAAGGGRKQLEMMLAGKPVNDWYEMGREAGGTSHTGE